MSDRDEREQQPTDDVARLAASLREGVPMRPAWREAVLREIAAAPAPRRPPDRAPRAWWRDRHIAVSPLGLAAAAVVCIAAGAGAAAALLSGRETAAPPIDATAPSIQARTVAEARPIGAAPTGGGTAVRFVIVAPRASRVSVVGNFNGWNPTAAPMARAEGGDAWVRDVVLASGRHAYAFVVDGAIHVDPSAPRAAEDDFGIPSSAIVVPAVAQ
jgi:hypothetical protein